MARTFNGTSAVLSKASFSGLDGYSAVSFGGWVKRNGAQPDTGFGTMMTKLRTGGSGQPPWVAFIKTTGVRVRLNTTADDSLSNVWEISNDFVSGEWHHFFCTWESGEKPTIYFDGVARTLSTDNGTLTGTMPVQTNTVLVGAADAAGSSLRFKGDLAELALWSVALTAAEVASLGKGVAPIKIRPQSLVPYWNLIGRTTDENDLRGVCTLTASNTTAAAHPRIYL